MRDYVDPDELDDDWEDRWIDWIDDLEDPEERRRLYKSRAFKDYEYWDDKEFTDDDDDDDESYDQVDDWNWTPWEDDEEEDDEEDDDDDDYYDEEED